MIKVEYKETLTSKGKTHQLRITGHAKYAEYGKDIVCSAASMLFLTLVKEMSELKKRNYFDEFNAKGYGDEQFVEVSEAHTDMEGVIIECIMETVLQGYLMLQENYPENVMVSHMN